MKFILLNIIRVYQILKKSIIPGPTCRFNPSCSEYTLLAIEKCGIINGCFLGIRRIVKCHPFHPGGNDPLPDSNR